MTVSHFVPADQQIYRLGRAACGRLVQPERDHSVTTTCQRCLLALSESAALAAQIEREYEAEQSAVRR